MLALGLAATDASRRPYWGITVLCKLRVNSIMRISAPDSSFIINGALEYGWRDDSLFSDDADGIAFDGEPYTAAVAASEAAVWCPHRCRLQIAPTRKHRLLSFLSIVPL